MSKTSRGALLTIFAMLCFAGMDTISKWLVADYPVGQMMWIRSALFFLFAWFVVRRDGLRTALVSQRPRLQVARALVAVVEGAAFVLAFRYLPLADTHAVAATSPLIVIAMGVLWLGERANLARLRTAGATTFLSFTDDGSRRALAKVMGNSTGRAALVAAQVKFVVDAGIDGVPAFTQDIGPSLRRFGLWRHDHRGFLVSHSNVPPFRALNPSCCAYAIWR